MNNLLLHEISTLEVDQRTETYSVTGLAIMANRKYQPFLG